MAAKKKQAKTKEGKSKAAKGGKKAPAPKAKVAPAKSGDGAPAKPQSKGKEKKTVDREPLKAKVQEAKKALDKAYAEANALREKAKGVDAAAKKAYAEVLTPYREACRKAGVECKFVGGRATNVTPAVRFLVERVKGGVKVMIKDKPKPEEVITDAALKESIGKAAFAYTDKFIGPRETVGAKGAGLGNRLRAALKAK